MPGPRADRAAVVLCGGESTRMGRPKALLPFGGETLLARVLRACAAACGELVVVAAREQELPGLPPGATVVRDEVPRSGPLEGLAVGLAAARAPAAFCTPCDVPFLRPALVERLFDALGGAAAAQAEVDGFPQPLLAVYRTSLAGKAARLVREDRRRVIFLVEGERVVRLPAGEVRAADPDLASFRNCNTPGEYDAALRDAGLGPAAGGLPLRVEFFGVARARTGREAVVLEVPAGATLGDALERLAAVLPELVGPVLEGGGRGLAPGSIVSFDGERFTRDAATPLVEGKPLLLLPASSGG